MLGPRFVFCLCLKQGVLSRVMTDFLLVRAFAILKCLDKETVRGRGLHLLSVEIFIYNSCFSASFILFLKKLTSHLVPFFSINLLKSPYM